MEGAAGQSDCDDPWPRRFRKRLAAVHLVKSMSIFYEHPDIDVPDPLDMTISKRRWEKLVREWKAHLRGVVPVVLQSTRLRAF